MRIQIPVKVDEKHRVTIPKEVWRKIAPLDEVLIEYDMGQPQVIHIVVTKTKEEEEK
jgi:bifunctional DNA-binding transcriptional regulator/antitoxin component of YhaV-PrlF toxin-antitoxin module